MRDVRHLKREGYLIARDFEAVANKMTEKWSNGLTAGRMQLPSGYNYPSCP